MQEKDDKLQTNFGATIWGLALLALVGTGQHICANCATCSWEPLTMLNPQFVAGEHGLFGGHKSEDIRTFLNYEFSCVISKEKTYFLSILF